jgi:hypothetical protein
MRDDRNTSLKCDIDETASTRVYCIKLHVRVIKSKEDMEPQEIFKVKLQNFIASTEKGLQELNKDGRFPLEGCRYKK